MGALLSQPKMIAVILRATITLALLLVLTALWFLQSTLPAKGWPLLGWPNPLRYKAEMQISGTVAPEVAENLMRVTPLSADTLAILALSAAQENNDQLAASAMTVAGRMGWRQQGVQAFWLQTALAAQDWKVAAERMDALLRAEAPDELWQDSLKTLLANPEGLKAMAARAAYNPEWTSLALVSVDTDRIDRNALADRLALVDLAWRQGLRIDCPALARLTDATLEADLAARGNDLWTRRCDPGSIEKNGVLNLSTSDSMDQIRSRFNWTGFSSGRFSVNLTPNKQGGAEIHINSSSMTSENVARRYLTLRSGKYRLSWKVVPDTAIHGISFTILCRVPDRPQHEQVPAVMDADGGSMTFTIPQNDCPAQYINLVIASSNKSFSSMTATVTDIRLRHLI